MKYCYTWERIIKLGISSILAILIFDSILIGQSITALRVPTSIASGGGAGTTGYPYATYVRILGWTACASSQAYLKLYSGSNVEYMWKDGTPGAWSNTNTYSVSSPIVNIDASGNWSGWIYAKHNDALGTAASIRAAKVGATSTNLTSSSIAFSILTTTSVGNGGWVVRNTSPAVNKGILAYSGTTVVGTYRTEDNSITEGYSYGSGGFKIAVPIGVIDSLVSINDDNSRDQVFVGPWVVSAGSETDVSLGGGQIGKGSASIDPSIAEGNVSQSLNVKIYGQTPYTITNTKIVVHPLFTWSHLTSSITLTGGGSPSKSINGDTVIISGASLLGGDSLQVQISSITPPDSTDNFAFVVHTGTHPDSIYAIGTHPKILIHGTPKTIADVKVNDANGVPLFLNKYVTVRGIITVANEFGSPAYIQDNTGGFGVYGTAFSTSVNVGDEVLVLGIVSPFNGLSELNNLTLLQIFSTGNVVSPLVVNCADVSNDGAGGIEKYEGLLVRINGVTVETTPGGGTVQSWTVSGSGTNYRLRQPGGAGDTAQIRVDNNVNFANTPAPPATFDVVGVVSQYKTTSPYIGGYQLMPRSSADIISQGPLFATLPVESNLTTSSFRISWQTVNNGTSRLRYGTTTAYELGVIEPDNTLRTNHQIDVNSLSAATIYHVKAFSVSGSDTSNAGDLIVSTVSPPASTGQIKVYFNKSVDNSVSTGENALGNQDLVGILVQRINNAHYSIDACLYSLSASGQGDVIASALITAKNRGVKVRVICEYDNSNSPGSSFPTLSSNGITVITDRYDIAWNGQGLMHDKFFVFDYRGGPPESVWVSTGSWNPTYQGTVQDRQNSIYVQDVAVAGAYTTEFNEMWGSSTDTPNQSMSRFGARKSNNTPHNFIVNGIPVNVYFSPTDQTTSHICTTVGKAQHSVSVSILTFTRKDIADTLIARKNGGDKVRVVVDNNTDMGNQYSYLLGAGIDIHLKGGSGLLHHKYAIVDADQTSGAQYLLTGSHNWSNSAENSNDENTIIIQDSRVANLYLQEFVARYYEAGGTDSIKLSLSPKFSVLPDSLNFGIVDSASSKQDSVLVTNAGSASLVISNVTSTNAQFTVTPTNATVPASASQKFYITLTAPPSGHEYGSIIFIHNAAGSPDTVSVQGQASFPIFSVTPDSLNFGVVDSSLSKKDSVLISNSGRASLVISNVTSTNARFTVTPANAIISPSTSKKIYVTFTAPPVGSVSGHVIFTHNAGSTPDTIFVRGQSSFNYVTDTAHVRQGWNMVSVPVFPSDRSKNKLFPSAISSAFAYEGAYLIKDTLMNGIGYWMKYRADSIITMSGITILTDSINVTPTWNLIGSISRTVQIGAVVEDPPNIIESSFFRYSGSYSLADSIEPMKAYWVKVNQTGKLILSNSSKSRMTKISEKLMGMNYLVISDTLGHRQTLYFGQRPMGDFNRDLYELPPVFTDIEFDARFENGKNYQFFEKGSQKPAQFPIKINSAFSPLFLQWGIDCNELNYYTLTVVTRRGTATIRLVKTSQTAITDPLLQDVVLVVSPERLVPKEFSLSQNFPNPFNPTTLIQYKLPSDEFVSLVIYDLLGREITHLVSERKQAGYYEVNFSAENFPSGIYYYKLTAGQYHDLRKMVILK